jgi:hypothetical protein
VKEGVDFRGKRKRLALSKGHLANMSCEELIELVLEESDKYAESVLRLEKVKAEKKVELHQMYRERLDRMSGQV